MQYLKLLLFIIQIAKLVHGTCVLESEFGFTINCNFKKSGLFRVRNLGGLKAHIGLGFSLGDELGFPESLGNVEGERRRALNYKTDFHNNIGVLPASDLPSVYPQQIISDQKKSISESRPRQLIPPANRPIVYKPPVKKSPSLMTMANPLPLGVPAFRPISNKLNNPIKRNVTNIVRYKKNDTYNDPQLNRYQNIPHFQALPSSVSSFKENQNDKLIQTNLVPQLNSQTIKALARAANVSEASILRAIEMRKKQILFDSNKKLYSKNQIEKIDATTSVPFTISEPSVMPETSILPEDFNNNNNNNNNNNKITTTTTSPGAKVMNAPIEYYPVGYEKNFDDNFASKVNLPHTTFNCQTQKHFPGLYADMHLGCMVFHVCALTDDGLIMKSFLCPESTLFDQTILKCNWWFYVDCKNSKNVYDSNIPISKSYQLMKSLTYFSNYNKNNSTEDFDIDALKNTVMENTKKTESSTALPI